MKFQNLKFGKLSTNCGCSNLIPIILKKKLLSDTENKHYYL